jgi:hypothetical protein
MIDHQTLNRRDGFGVTGAAECTIRATTDIEVLAIEVPIFG